MFQWIKSLFNTKEETKFSTFYQDYYTEQIERIRRGEPIEWLPGTPISIRLESMEIDRLNEKLDDWEKKHT